MNFKFSNKYIIILEQFINSLISLLLTIYIARHMGIKDLGLFNLYFAIIFLSQIFSSAYSFETLNIFFSKLTKKRFFSYNFFILIIINIIFICFVYFINSYFFYTYSLSFFLFLYIFIYNLKIFLKKIIILNSQFFKLLVVSIINIFLILFFLFFFLKDMKNIQEIFKYLILIDSIILIIFFPILIKKLDLIKIKFFIKYLKLFFLRGTSFLILGAISNFKIYLIPFILVKFFDPETVGIYRIFITILGIAHVLIQSFENIYPKIFYENNKKNLKINIYTKANNWLIYFLSIYILIFILMDNILEFIFKSKIDDNITIYLGVCCWITIDLYKIFFSYLMRVKNLIRLNLKINIIIFSVDMCLIISLLLIFGKIGFLYSGFLSLVFMLIIFNFITKKING